MEKNYVQQVESQRYAISLYGTETMEGEMVECNKNKQESLISSGCSVKI